MIDTSMTENHHAHSTQYTVITGASSGIGEATAYHFAEMGHRVCLIARRAERLEAIKDQVLSAYPKAPEPKIIVSDLSENEGIDQVIEALRGERISCLLHNAAAIQPIMGLLEVSRDAWRKHFRLNVEAPLFITQGLVRELRGGRVFHISSGAAHKSIQGWGAYCASKATLYSVWASLSAELIEEEVALASVRPGVVDTEMQAEIRAADHPRFTQRSYFEGLKEREELTSPQDVARYLYQLFAYTTDSEFIQREWDIREHPAPAPL